MKCANLLLTYMAWAMKWAEGSYKVGVGGYMGCKLLAQQKQQPAPCSARLRAGPVCLLHKPDSPAIVGKQQISMLIEVSKASV